MCRCDPIGQDSRVAVWWSDHERITTNRLHSVVVIHLSHVSKFYKASTRPALDDVIDRRREGRVRLRHRSVRIGQVDLSAPVDPRRHPDLRHGRGRRPGPRAPASVEGRCPPSPARLRVPGFPVADQQDGRTERRIRPRGDRPVPRVDQAGGTRGARDGRAWRARPIGCRTSCPAVSSSGWRSPARSPTGRCCCWRTSRPATSTRTPARTSCCCSSGSTGPAPPC